MKTDRQIFLVNPGGGALKAIVIAFLCVQPGIEPQAQVPNPELTASTTASATMTPVGIAVDEETESDHPGDEDCGRWKDLAPNQELQAMTWLIPDPKHPAQFERFGFSLLILRFPFSAKERVIARHDFIGLRISHMRWSPDSKFLLFTTGSGAGHSPSHSRAFVFCATDNSFRDFEAAVGSVVSPEFRFEAPDVAVLKVQKGESPESEQKIDLAKIMNRMPTLH